MNYHQPLLFLIFFLLASACNTSKQSIGQNENVQNKLIALMGTNEIPGINCSIVYKDGRIEDYAVGYADLENKIPNNASYRLLSGSIGKTYAVALLYQLIDAGKVNLDDKLVNYIPEVDWLDRLANINDITIRMLLQHTSGLPRWVLKDDVWASLNTNPEKVWSYRDRMEYIFDETPVHEAGKGWAYSDTNYILLGMLIEKMYSQEYYSCLQEKVLGPNKLKNTVPSNKREIPHLISAYSKLPENFKIPNKVVMDGKYTFNPQVEWTGGGMASSAHDLALWCKLYYEAELFSEALVKQTTTINPNGKEVMGPHSYGMGSFVYNTSFGEAYGHSGFMPGFNAIMMYFPGKKMAVALQANCDYAGRKMNLVSYVEEVVGAIDQ